MDSPSLIDERALVIPTSVQATTARTAAPRPVQRGRFTNYTLRDDALVSWLASRNIAPWRKPFEVELAGAALEFSPHDRPAQPIDALELAFAALD